MAVKAITHSYWRSIKQGNRAFDSIPKGVKEDVRVLARQDVDNGVVTPEEYLAYTGEKYQAREA